MITGQAQPTTAQALAEEGLRALRAGDAATAMDRLKRAASMREDVGVLVNLALAAQALGDQDQETAAIERALTLQPRLLVGLLLKGNLYERRGERARAAEAYAAAIAVAPPFQQVPPDLQPAVRHAHALATAYNAEREAFLRDYLKDRLDGREAARFDRSVDVMFGRRDAYRSQPHVFGMPELPNIQFYDRELFPWLPAVEAATDDIRSEFLAILEADEGFQPYIAYAPGMPTDQWTELNHSPRWSAYHLIKDGQRVEEHCARCPKTMAALAEVPGPEVRGRTPVAMFSVLRPKTKIPPHTGVTNTRLVVHIPLIVPDGCRYRVGNEWREWKVGEAFVFDDSIEHEAINDSDHTRTVLIFDIWNPYVTDKERALIQAMFEGLDAFAGAAPEGWSSR
jgi:aspartyl/asparaginyl beta-hydroxylase (cupin superfamily)